MIIRYYLPFILIILSFDFLSNLNAQAIDRSLPERRETETKEYFDSEINQKAVSETKDDLCIPLYSSGCNDGDGFTDFALEEIENYGSACDDNMGVNGWSQYLELGPAFLIPGNSHDIEMRTGYNDQSVSIWIDFNDDFILEENEIVLYDFELAEAGQFYTATIEVPPDATPGQHFMRARACWSGTCSDPCEEYNYGEAEDYYVFIGEAVFGSLEGNVTELDGGAAVEGATISLDGANSYSTTTGADGIYLIENILVGDYTVECFKEGYNPAFETVSIEEDIIAIIDFQLTQPNINLSPMSISKTLAPNTTGEETLIIENTGNGELNWSASMLILNESSKDFMDLQFQYPAEGSYNEAGIETDGNFIYTTEWGGNGFFKYDLDGNFIEEFTIPDTYAIRDLAYDGTHFYGGSASLEVFEMDFDNQDLISTFVAPTEVRAIAYNDEEDVFYANNWNSPIFKFDKTGTALGSFEVGPVGDDYYGFAYDNNTFGGPFLWGYAQVGSTENVIVQIQLPSGTETGFTLDVTTVLSGNIWGHAGGMFTHSNLIYGKTTLGGVVQGEWLWGLELGEAPTWLWVNPTGGTLEAGSSEEISVLFDASGMESGVYNAEIHFSTWPDVGTPIVDVTLTVTDLIPDPPSNLFTAGECDTMQLCWEVTEADSFSVYSSGVWEAYTIGSCYTFFGPDAYNCYVTSWLGGVESEPSETLSFDIEWPEDSEPVSLAIEGVINNIVYLSWDIPQGCAAQEGYNVYRNGIKMNDETIFELTYSDTLEYAGTFEYYATAVYYFGESDPSNIEAIVITSIEHPKLASISIFPNPAKDRINIVSNEIIRIAEITNLQGNVLIHEDINAKDFQINISSLESGIYILRLENNKGTSLKKIVIR